MFLPAPRFTKLSGINLVEAVQGSVTAGGSNTVTMPANAGRSDILVVAFIAAAPDDPNSAPSLAGFTSLQTRGNTTDYARHRVAYAFGPGATAVMTTNSTTRNVAYVLYSFSGAKLAEAPSCADASEVGNNTGPNPPSRTPTVDGSEIIVMGTHINTTTTTGYGAPSGYSNLLVQSANDTLAQNAVLLVARKNQSTAAAEDPGNFTPTSTDGWGAATLVITPA